MLHCHFGDGAENLMIIQKSDWLRRSFFALAVGLGLYAAGFAPAAAQPDVRPASSPALTYADLVDLAEPAEHIIRAKIRKQASLESARSPGLSHGFIRVFIVAKVIEPLVGASLPGDSYRYLVDVPLRPDGKPPKLKGSEVIIFAHGVPNRPGELQLVAPDAQVLAGGDIFARLAPVLTELSDADRPPLTQAIRDILAVQGNLAGESETQLFLSTGDGGTALVSVIRRPGAAPVWGVSWGELISQAPQAPPSGTLAWYRLACALPAHIPRDAHLSSQVRARVQAEQDYALVLRSLGGCPRNRRFVP